MIVIQYFLSVNDSLRQATGCRLELRPLRLPAALCHSQWVNCFWDNLGEHYVTELQTLTGRSCWSDSSVVVGEQRTGDAARTHSGLGQSHCRWLRGISRRLATLPTSRFLKVAKLFSPQTAHISAVSVCRVPVVLKMPNVQGPDWMRLG